MLNIFKSKSITKPKLLYIFILLVAPLLTLLLMETLHRGSFLKALLWIPESSFAFLVSYTFLFLFISALNFVPEKLYIPFLFIQAFLWGGIAYGSYKKFQLRGDYLTPSDLELLSEGVSITNYLSNLITWKFILLIILILAALVGIIYLIIKATEPIHFKYRLILSLLSVAGMVALLYNPTVFSLRASAANNIEEYEKLGLVGGFLNLQEKTKIVHPVEYSEAEVQKIVDSLQQSSEVNKDFNPNVIVVLAEALWDPLLLENLSFEKDPIPFFRSLTENYTSGDLITHIFGGGTINTELEIMTGLSTRFLPEGKESYNSQITRPIDSLAHQFRNQGYNSYAVHTFKNWFYDRNLTYKWLGYEKFVSMEFFSNPPYIGPYIDDRVLMEQTLAEIKKTNGPDFVNTITVSSHGPYDDIRYDELPSCTNSPQLTKVPQYILDLYCQVLKETDDALKLLIEGVEDLDEPTMVVIYGDHLPMLGYDYAVYREANFFSDLNSYEDYMKLHTAPFVVWDNFSDPEEKEHLRMTPNFLGSYILSHAQKEKSPIFLAAEQVYSEGMNVIPIKQFNEQEGIDEAKLKAYQMLQYDTLYGEQYNYKETTVKPAKDYYLGSEKMILKSADRKKNTITITGKHFVSNAKIFINDEEQKTEFINGSKLKATLPDNLKDIGKVTITIKVLDDKNNSIAESNSIKLKLE